MIEGELRGEKEFRQSMERSSRFIDQHGPRWLGKIGMVLTNTAKTKLVWWNPPKGGRYTGRLAHSISGKVEKEGCDMVLRWGTDVDYARYVEGYPTAPREHFLSFERFPEIKRWCARHGLPVENMWGLKVGGEKSVHPFLKPAIDEKRSWIASDFLQVFGRMAEV